ncbi:MAG: oxygen-independent coproporphyrinogen III oxidase [Crocinitomicaceae bacterium]|nr:oxygen-independent coproporphyrinogen III oxidase [Crocinitomicaceae bacterium]
MDKELIRKYNIPGPRYTSYPTVPFWAVNPTKEQWKEHVQNTFKKTNKTQGISLYIHLPYCESLCTFCGCNKRITVNHAVEMPYIETLLKEWKMYVDLFDGERPQIAEIHLGGGTPTFFSPESLKFLLEEIYKTADLHPEAELGFEGHPKNTTREHLQTLYDLGFRRVSCGVQDFNPTVQQTINRIQPFEMVKEVDENARAVGYTSVNYDLVFGLPHQHIDSIEDTIEKINTLKPDRIAYYSYAHVPWVSPGQRGYSEEDLPKDEEKRILYERGKELFEKNGYEEIGMDHFALKTDNMYKAFADKRLHRNFMGYSVLHTDLMIGLGVSSISDSWTCFAQNEKKVEDYKAAVEAGDLPIFRGHILSEQDELIRKKILDLMCHFESDFSGIATEEIEKIKERLAEPLKDELLVIEGNSIQVLEKGKPFVRNICMAFDLQLHENAPKDGRPIFSKTV